MDGPYPAAPLEAGAHHLTGGIRVRLGKLTILAIALLALALLLGCTSAPPAEDATQPTKDPGGSIVGSWNCVTFTVGGSRASTIPTDTPITAEFTAEGELSGNAGVNSYSTTYETDGGSLKIGSEIATTKMAGSDAAMKQESDYLTVLVTAQSYQIDDKTGELVLFGPAQNTIARYTPAQ